MRRFITVAIVVATAFVAFQSSADARTTSGGPCAHWRHHRGGVVKDVKACTRRAIRRWHVPGSKREAFKVESCESTFHPTEDNGQYSGVFQIGDTEWHTWNRPQRYRRWFHGSPGPHDGAANIITGIFHASHAGWGAWACR